MKTETVRLADQVKSLREIAKQLDRTNIRILSAMWRFSPRNLLEVARQTKIPFTTVYHRVAKLEAKAKRVAYLIPTLSKLGMVGVVVLLTAKPGSEEKVTAALKIPNFWSSVGTCEGAFSHHSIHAVPAKFLKDFRRYVKRISEIGLATQVRIIPTGDWIPNFPNFKYYNPSANEWKFEWNRWLAKLKRSEETRKIGDPDGYRLLADKKDILIVKELERNARRTFAEIAPLLRISLQGVKYHYDRKLLPQGIVRHFAFDIFPYPMEISAYHESLLQFAGSPAMNRFFSMLEELFFVLSVAKVPRQNSLFVRTYILQPQLPNMFAFFSQMVKTGLLESYSSVRLSLTGRMWQTISYELFDDQKGWTFDLKKSLLQLSKLQYVTIRTRENRV